MPTSHLIFGSTTELLRGMGLKRRAFLRQTGLLLAALGLSEASLSLLGKQYQQALAQPTRRKLALLVGINQYPESVCDYIPKGSALGGCLTDVELQQELLIHRFGFQPADILTLTDEAATRRGIEAAFLDHLVRQAQPEDVVLFHFSGLGSQIQIEGAIDHQHDHQRSLVPIDGMLPTADEPIIHDLPETTLQLLLQSLPTDQVITVLDSGYTSVGRNLQGNLRIRSRPSMPIGMLDEAELAFQEQLLRANPTLSRKPRLPDSHTGSKPYPGILLQASAPNRIATEVQWSGFTAGLFTYALTQQLWWAAPATTLRISFNRASGVVKQAAGTEQQPIISDEGFQKLLPVLALRGNADGVIRSIDEEGKAALWLAGLPAIVVENAGASLFSIAADEPDDGTEPAEPRRLAQLLQSRSRDGLTLKAKGLSVDSATVLQPGQLVYEEVRFLPRNIGLTIALDPSLKRIERVDATSAFSAIPKVSSVIAGEQPADFLFGKTQPQVLAAALPLPDLLNSPAAETAQDVPPVPESPAHPAQNSYGLFYLGRDAIPNTLSQEAEAVKTSVNRMTAQLKTLLAIKLLRLTQNQGSSRLGVRAALETISPQERLVLQQETVRAPRTAPTSKVATLLLAESSPILTASSQIQYRLQNYSNHLVYFLLIGLEPKGNAVIFYPPKSELSPASLWAAMAPGETRIIPQISAANWLVQTSSGLAETYLIFSRSPFTQTLQVLEAEVRSKVDIRPVTALLNPLEVVQAVLQDLHQASSETVPVEIPADTHALDVNAWATLSFVYQVVAT
jgi:hypothetical protein